VDREELLDLLRALDEATPAALHRLKRDTVRAIDRQDAAALRRRFGLADNRDE